MFLEVLLCINSSDQTKRNSDKKERDSVTNTLGETDGCELNWKCHQDRKKRGRLSGCYSVMERDNDEIQAPKKAGKGKKKTIVGFIGKGLIDPSIQIS